MSRLRFGLLSLLTTLLTSHVRAAPEATKPTSNAVCDRETTAIGRSACRLADSLAGQADSALVVAAPAVTDERVAVPGAISERLAQLVAAKLGNAAQPSKESLTLPQAQRAANSARGLIYLTVALYRDRMEEREEEIVGTDRN